MDSKDTPLALPLSRGGRVLFWGSIYGMLILAMAITLGAVTTIANWAVLAALVDR